MTHLSPRHREIVELVGRDGLTYPEVAKRLGISKHTVVRHAEAIKKRADYKGRTRVVLVRIYWNEIAGAPTP